MRISELLVEKATSVLYHITSIPNLFSILNEKQFRLTSSVGTKSEREMNKGKMYFLSTSRTKINDYTLQNSYFDSAILVLNGDWFNRRHRGVPTDYWEGNWIKKRKIDIDSYREAEDRILSDDPIIKINDLKSVIREVHIFYENEYDYPILVDRTRKAIFLAKKHNIPVYVYNNKKDFVLLNKTKSLDLRQVFKNLQGHYKPVHSQRTDYLQPWRELYYKTSKQDLSSRARRRLDTILHYNKNEAISAFTSDLHNQKSGANPGIVKTVRILRKERKSPEEFLDLLREKWTKILTQEN